MSDDIFSRYGEYYDLIYQDKDYESEADYVARILHEAGVRSVLEFGSGTGRHGRLLAGRGFDVHGIERSAAMVESARRKAVDSSMPAAGSFSCQLGDIRTTGLARRFDAVVSLFHVVSYQTTNDDLERTMANASRHLEPGGIFLFDVWHGPAVLSDRPAVRIKRIEDAATELWRLAEPTVDTHAGVVTVEYTLLAGSKADGQLTKIVEAHRMRYLFPTEIESLARHAGFSIDRVEEPVTGHAASDRTWGVAYLLRKSA